MKTSQVSEIGLDSRKQLFLDDYFIRSMSNIERTIHPAVKYGGNPVIWKDQPWENPMNSLYGSIFYEADRYRMWYKSGMGVSYAESDDGIGWTKPALDFVEIDGRKTNILFRKTEKFGGTRDFPFFYELFGVHRDDADVDPSRRYKMGFLSIQRSYEGPREDPYHKGQRRGLAVACSADGFAWRLNKSWATEAICDGATHWMWDPSIQSYVLYGRTKFLPPEVRQAWSSHPWFRDWFSARSVARVESKNFLEWNFTDPGTAPVVMSSDIEDPPGTEIYSICVFPYESMYIGLIQLFHGVPEGYTLDVQLAVSRDSLHFERVGDRTPFIPLGSVGSWDRFNHSIANNPPVAAGNELRFYYGGRTYRHGPYKGEDTGAVAGGIGFASINRDRFVSLGASYDGGEVLTPWLNLNGTALHLNARSGFGEIVVEVINRKMELIARSKPISTDSLDTPVFWQLGDLQRVKEPVSLRIYLKNALLFSVWCEE